MPRKVEGKTSVRIDLEGTELQRFETIKTHYSISSNKDLVSMLLKKEYDRITKEQGKDSFGSLVEFFEKNPDLLKKMGYDSVGQLVQQMLKETSSSRHSKQQENKPVENTQV